MSKNADNDLFIFLEALKSSRLRGFKRELQNSSGKNDAIKLDLVEETVAGGLFGKDGFLEKHGISDKQFSTLKFQLFQDLLNYLKVNYEEYSDVALHNNIIEYELLLNKGLYSKAAKRFKKIIEISIEKCDFNSCSTVYVKAIEHNLYRYMRPVETLKEASENLRKFQALSENLISFKLLSNEVLQAHYAYMDRRATNSDEILEYLEHPLLQDVSQAKSTLAVFYYYRTKATVYNGNIDFKKTKEYSLKAYEHLKQNPSPYRNDYLRSLICLNNYIDASFYLKETEPYQIMYPQMVDMTKMASDTADTYSKALIFQILTSLKLNYLRISKNTDQFYREIDAFKKPFQKYESILRPNFKLEIILNIANLYFLAGDLKMANEYCKKIDYEKSNPASLFISCALILRIMINFDLKNYRFLSHLVSTSKYSLQKRSRLFELERIFLKSFNKMKYYYAPKEQQNVFTSLYEDLVALRENSEDFIVSEKIGLLAWVKEKSSYQ